MLQALQTSRERWSSRDICGKPGLALAKALEFTLAILSARFVSELELHQVAKRGCAAGSPTLRAPHAAARAALKRRSIMPVGIVNTKPELCRTLEAAACELTAANLTPADVESLLQ